jgi:hypothetical protein
MIYRGFRAHGTLARQLGTWSSTKDAGATNARDDALSDAADEVAEVVSEALEEG